MKRPSASSHPSGSESGATSENSGPPTGHADGSLAGWLRSWRYFFWFLGFVLLVAVFYAEENWRGHRAWERYKQQMQNRGERLDSTAFVPKQVPESENFAMTPLLAPLFEFIPGTQKWRTTNAVAQAQGFAAAYDAAASEVKQLNKTRTNSWVTARTDLIAWHAAFLLKGQRTNMLVSKPTASDSGSDELAIRRRREAAAGVLAALSDSDSVMEEIREASHRPYSRFNIRYDQDDPAAILLPHLGVLKHLSQILQLRACAELALGRSEEAAADVNLMLYLADACRDEPVMVSQLIRMAQFRLAIQPITEGLGQWSEQQLRMFQERSSLFNFGADMKRALQAERVFFGGGVIDFLQRNPDNYTALAGNGEGPDYPVILLATVPSGWFDFEKLNYSSLFENYEMSGLDLAGHRISPTASRQADERITTLLGKSWLTLFLRHRVFSTFLLPGFAGPLRKTAFAQTAVDTTAVECALERYRLAHGEFPESLDALTWRSDAPANGSRPTALMERLPNDIINGQPLKYRRTPDGQYVLYSVGWNETDDGGNVEVGKGKDADVPQQGDWVFRPLTTDH